MVTEWQAALADAGVDEADYHLIVCPGAPAVGYGQAVTIPEGLVLKAPEDTDHIVATAMKMNEANDPGNINRHRIACFEDIEDDDPEAVTYLGALLRHEVEHGKQREAVGVVVGNLSNLSECMSELLASLGEGQYRDLRNSAPIEADANAASSAFAAKRHPKEAAVLALGENHYLFDHSTAPGSPSSLIERTVDWLWQYRTVLEDPGHLPAGKTFVELLEAQVPAVADLWRART